MTFNINLALRLSLSFLWVFTGITSLFFAKNVGYEVLASAGIKGTLADLSILSGSIIDVAIGSWLLIGKKLKYCYWLQMLIILIYTVLLTMIEPNFWLHPFGPLTKNVPLLVIIYYLYSKA